MNEGSSYCGCCSEIRNVSDAAKIINMVMTSAREGKSVQRKTVSSQRRRQDCWQTGWALLLEWKRGKREVDYFRGLLQETDKNKFGIRGIENQIIRSHPGRDESNSGLKVIYGVNHCSEREKIPGRKMMEQDEMVESIKGGRQIMKTEAIDLLLRDSVRKMVMQEYSVVSWSRILCRQIGSG